MKRKFTRLAVESIFLRAAVKPPKMRMLFCLLALLFGSCEAAPSKPSKTANETHSNMTQEQRVAFVERYVTFRRNYDNLWFHVVFHDNSGGIPGPADWDIKIVAKVPKTDLDTWIPKGVEMSNVCKFDWISGVTDDVDPKAINECYRTDIGFDRTKRIVAYRNTTMR